MGASETLDAKPYWVYFHDKGYRSSSAISDALNNPKNILSSRSISRRLKLAPVNTITESDLPVNPDYVTQISKSSGKPLRHISRWLNAVSFELSETEVSLISEFAFVEKVEPVRSFLRQDRDIIVHEEHQIDPYIPRSDPDLDYGTSLRQNAFINAPELHDRGYLGRGVMVGVCDAGFDNLDHNCFAEIDIVDSWDFVNDDDEVGDEDDMGDGNHGTKILSIIGGYQEGRLIGIAPEASYVLAKTENTEREVEVEEDHWVAAVEWMDSLGVDIVTSSLSYSDWYEYEDMDGNTAVTTVVADRASEVGIVIVNAMGNTGRGDYPETKMGAPADGDYVISVGATNRDSSRASFSSHGPTWDERIKPDLMSYGVSVKFASSRNNQDYAAGAGTSFSTPAIAGLCALLIQANPYLSPVTLLDALKESANNAEEPDTLMGWGIPDGLAVFETFNQPEIEIEINMRGGWTTISHNLSNEVDFDFVEVFEAIVEREHLLLVKDQHGSFYAPGEEFNNLAFWNSNEGYQVHLTDDDALVLEGERSNYRDPIQLAEGWNLTAYKPSFTLPVESACRSLTDIDALVIAKDHRGRFYLPSFNFSNMDELRPGRGYHIKLNEPASLIYPRERVGLDNTPVFTQHDPVHLPVVESGSNSMSLLIQGDKSVQDGDEVGCYNSEGVLIGSGVFVNGLCGIALWGNKEDFFPQVSVFRATPSGYFRLNPEIQFVSGSTDFIPDSYSVIEVSLPVVGAALDQSSFSITTSPNPFNESCVITYLNSDDTPIQIDVYDILGRNMQSTVLSKHPVNGIFRISASKWAAGDYFVRVKNGRMIRNITIHHIR